MRGYVIGRIGTRWFLYGLAISGTEAEMRAAGYTDVHTTEKIDRLPIVPARA